MNHKCIPSHALAQLRQRIPLVHHITNLVTMNDCANMTLCIGASPVMSDSLEESLQLTDLAGALVLNMGTLNPAQVQALITGGRRAKEKGIPVVFDPVGAGATPYRRETARLILESVRPDIVKGNLGEIKFLAGRQGQVRGVDSVDTGNDAAWAVETLARNYSCIACATGIEDLVSDGESTWAITGGCAELGRVCGTGCMSASLMASFAAALCADATGDQAQEPGRSHRQTMALSAILGILTMNRAGELALERSKGSGLGSFRTGIFDAVSLMADQDLEAHVRVKELVHA